MIVVVVVLVIVVGYVAVELLDPLSKWRMDRAARKRRDDQ